MDFVTSAVILAWIILLALSFAVSALIRQVHEISTNAQFGQSPTRGDPEMTLPIGSKVPGLDLADDVELPAVVLFADANCSTCQITVAAFADRAPKVPALAFSIVFSGVALPEAHAEGVRVLENMAQAFALLRLPPPPFMFLIDGDGILISARSVRDSQEVNDFVGMGAKLFGGVPATVLDT